MQFMASNLRGMTRFLTGILAAIVCLAALPTAGAQTTPVSEVASTFEIVKAAPGEFRAITEPPCSYCSTQHRKGLINGDDRVIAWLRASHNGGAFPLRHFLSASRVVNDTYGLFFYDPDGGYVSAFPNDYGYELYGWKNGVMVVRSEDGTLWSALTGKAFDGPRRGQRLQRIPSLVTNWDHWMMLHPESTAYDLFDGKTYEITPLPVEMHASAKASMSPGDERLEPMTTIMGVESGDDQTAFVLDTTAARDCILGTVGGEEVAVLWYGATQTAVTFSRKFDGRSLTLYADDISPESAPFKDKETGTRWTVAGRGVDGPLRGQELTWVSSIQCRWHAWSAEYPETDLHENSR